MNKDNLTNYFLNEALCYLMTASISSSSFEPWTHRIHGLIHEIIIYSGDWILYVPTDRFSCPLILRVNTDDELYNRGFISRISYKDIMHPHIKNVTF